MRLFLAVDGGQTTTKIVLANERAQILAQATGGPSNHTEEPGGPERLEKTLRISVNEALQAAGRGSIEQEKFAAACFGMTGETTIKRRVLERLVRTPRLTVVHDSVNALVGATAGKPGVIVIAGTGSVARGMSARGREVRAGGWGHLFGDEGSAYWISREAVRAVAGELEGFREATRLTSMLIERLRLRSADAIMQKYYSGEWSRDHLAGLAVWVNEAAAEGDEVARSILRGAGRELARLARAVLSVLFRARGKGGAHFAAANLPVVSYAGGVFENQYVLAAFKERLRRSYPQVRVEPPLLPPVLGSLLLAYRRAGIEISGTVRRAWNES